MQPFPYFEILRQAWGLTKLHPWLWVFGFFAGGTAGINFGGFNYLFSPPTQSQFALWASQGARLLDWIQGHPLWFSGLVALILVTAVLAVVFAGISRGALIWTGGKLADQKNTPAEEVRFGAALRQGRQYFWRIIGLQAVTTVAFLLVFALYVVPVAYLFSVGAVSRAVFLSVFGLLIFVPVGMVLSFTHLYGPIFQVLYGVNILAALQYAFNLLRQKIVESILMAALLILTSFVFVLILVLSLLILSLPLIAVAFVLLQLHLPEAALVWALGSGLLLICYTVVLGAAFAVFQNLAWVLAVRHLVRTTKLEKEEEAYATGPA